MATVTLLGVGAKPIIRKWSGETGLYHALAEEHLMDAPCGGRGRCGKCRILVQEGNVPANAEDRQFFTEEELDEIDQKSMEAIEESVKFAMESPEPTLESAFEDIFAD